MYQLCQTYLVHYELKQYGYNLKQKFQIRFNNLKRS